MALLAVAGLLAGCAGPVDETAPRTLPEPTAPTADEPGRAGDPVEPADPGDAGNAGEGANGRAGDALDGELTIEVDVEGDTATWTLTCDPAGGDHPDPEAACAAIVTAGGRGAFEPVPADMMCTQQWGGPETARVTGTLDGSSIDTRFERTNGCEIARWAALAPLFGGVGVGAGADVAE